jgi:hypothetical protein
MRAFTWGSAILTFLLAGCAFPPSWIGGPLPAPMRQPDPTVLAGDKVRVYVPASEDYVRIATVVALSGDTLVLDRWPSRSAAAPAGAASARIGLPLGAIGRLEVSHGRRQHIEVGLAAGSLVGVVAGYLACGPTWGFDFGCEHPEMLYIVAVPVALAGAALGTRWTEDWEDVPVDGLRGLRLGLVRQPGGRVGLGAALAF